MYYLKKLQHSAARMVQQQNKQYDLVVFGATGYTGQFMVEYVAKAVDNDYQGQTGDVKKRLKWAVAGRNESKLNMVLDFASNKSKFDLTSIPLIICDVKDELSLSNMAAQAKVVLNCVGPYR
jgi:short subunit dehydrogenase-like uncharacterized protein